MKLPAQIAGVLLILMVAVILTLGLSPDSAHAGEGRPLGTILVSDGGTSANKTTGWAGYVGAGSFDIAVGEKITVQCRHACYVCVDQATCSSTTGMQLATNEKLLTDLNTYITATGYAYNSDGGTAGHAVTSTGGWLSVSPESGANCTCLVWSRTGKE